MGLEPAVVATGLRVRRGGADILRGIDVEIGRGDLVGLLGPSGCGKTTLLRTLVGSQRITGGGARVLGLPAGDPRLRGRIGYATQSASVYDDLSARQNLQYLRRVLGVPGAEVARVLRATHLEDVADRIVGSLSGGQRGRVSLAAALLGRPELLIFDEPTVGLDPVLRVELWTLFRALAEEGTTLLVSSHVMDEATRCDALVILREGRVLAQTTPAGLLASTGTTSPEGAFLAIVAADDGADDDRPEAARPRRGRRRAG